MKGHRDQFVRGNWTFEHDVTVQGQLDVKGPLLTALYGDGNKFYVDSNKGTVGQGKSWDTCLGTIDEAVGRCTADNGDIIFVAPGHVETVTAAGGLDLDVAGITIIFLGPRESQGYITFTTDVNADMDVDADGITMIRPKFVAGIDALTGPIDVNATDFTIIDGEYHEAASIETTDCIIATSGATRLKIDGWKYFKGTEAGTQKESHIQIDGVDDMILRNIYIEGDFDTGIIETGSDEWLRATLQNLYLKNTDPGNAPCLEMDSANSGWADNVHCRNANGTAVSDVADLNWSDTCLQYGTDGYGGEPIGTGAGSGVEAQVSQAVSEIGSVGTKASTVLSEVGSVGLKASTAVSEIGSVGLKASTAISEVGSVGGIASTAAARASTAVSEIGSVGTKTSTAISEIGSVGLKASTAVSEVGSVGVIASGVLSEVGSVGTKASTAISEVGSVGLIASGVLSEVGSVGTKSSTIISMIDSLWTAVSTKLSIIDSQVS